MKELIKNPVGLTTESNSEGLRWTLSKISEAHEGRKTQDAGGK